MGNDFASACCGGHEIAKNDKTDISMEKTKNNESGKMLNSVKEIAKHEEYTYAEAPEEKANRILGFKDSRGFKFEADIKRFSNKTRILNQNMFFLVFLSS